MSGIPWSGSITSTSLTEGNGIQPPSLSDWLLQEAFAFQTPGLVISVLEDIIQSSPPPGFGFWIPSGLRQVQDAKSPVLLELDLSVHSQKLSFHTAQELHGHHLQDAGILQAGQMLNKGFSKSHCGTEGSCIFLFRS